jgi:hypothetical protein
MITFHSPESDNQFLVAITNTICAAKAQNLQLTGPQMDLICSSHMENFPTNRTSVFATSWSHFWIERIFGDQSERIVNGIRIFKHKADPAATKECDRGTRFSFELVEGK